ncbi:MAG: hypothetical protein ACRD1E_00850, partial [Terriglobales bacterium]
MPRWIIRFGSRFWTLAALVLLLAWMAAASISVAGKSGFMLEVPALYLSVGQEFQPRLISLAATAAAPADMISVTLLDGSGQRLAAQQIPLDAAGAATAEPISLPRAATYELRARSVAGTQTITLHALPDPDLSYGGVTAVASLGLAPGVADYLRQHGFAVTELEANSAQPRLILVGDPRLGGANLAASFAQLWHAVAAGAEALLLQPIPAGVAQYWPMAGPLTAATSACSDDALAAPLTDGLAVDRALGELLHPALAFDVAQQSQLDLYHWDGRRLARANSHSGYAGCHALFSFRLGAGWVTYSTLPLLQRFQDVRARVYLMNLIKAVGRRKHNVPPSPGLQWVM